MLTLNKTLVIGAGLALLYLAANKPAAVVPETVEPWDNVEWFNWTEWENYFYSDNDGGWITETYQSASDWLSEQWDNLTE